MVVADGPERRCRYNLGGRAHEGRRHWWRLVGFRIRNIRKHRRADETWAKCRHTEVFAMVVSA